MRLIKRMKIVQAPRNDECKWDCFVATDINQKLKIIQASRNDDYCLGKLNTAASLRGKRKNSRWEKNSFAEAISSFVGIMRRLLRRYEINQKKNIIQASRNDDYFFLVTSHFVNIFYLPVMIVWTLRPEDWLGIKQVKPGIHHLRNVPMGINSIWK